MCERVSGRWDPEMNGVDYCARGLVAWRDVRTVDVRDLEAYSVACRHQPVIAVGRNHDLRRTDIDPGTRVKSKRSSGNETLGGDTDIDQADIQL